VPPSRADEHAEQDHERADEPRRSMLGRHSRAVVIGLIVFALTPPTGFLYWGYARHFESSDDAFIAARQFPIAPKVSGYITAVPVTDNQHIASGDVIARIDERDYRIALEQAQAQVANAKANVQNIDAQTNVQQAQIASNQAQVEQAKAALVFAQQQANRYTDLAKKGWDPVQTEQQYASQLRQQQAALDSAEANLKLAQRGAAGNSPHRRLSGTHFPRPRRQCPARVRHGLLAPAR
jgi:membrane fusion protein, multidrug efflux system